MCYHEYLFSTIYFIIFIQIGAGKKLMLMLTYLFFTNVSEKIQKLQPNIKGLHYTHTRFSVTVRINGFTHLIISRCVIQ